MSPGIRFFYEEGWRALACCDPRLDGDPPVFPNR